ncbi:chemotaxis protein CheW [Candidatus Electrothrix sp.]|uniref:chemotaxis protein CheW n=1 Tax=Candidatus Electrothrix sp. TaxID=2170559 RepID=UPI004055C6E7
MIDSSMLPDFIVEAAEHLEVMESSLLRLEQGYEVTDKELMDEIFRSIHSIKGAAQFVGIERVSELSHKLENLLDLIRRGEITLSPAITDLLIAGKDRLTLLVDELERTKAEETEVSDLVEQVRRVIEGEDVEDDAPEETVSGSGAAQEEVLQGLGEKEEQSGLLTEENMSDEFDEELYNIFLQQLKENIPFLYAQTVELSISVDKQDVLYRCSDSIKSLKSSANYMGYEKLTQHYSNWQHAIDNAVEQLSSGKMPNLNFMQDYIDEIIRSFPQAMEGYSYDDADELGDGHQDEQHETSSIDSALNSIFADEDPAGVSDSPVAHQEEDSEDTPEPEEVAGEGIDLDDALDTIFSDEHGGVSDHGENADFQSLGDEASRAEHSLGPVIKEEAGNAAETVPLEYELSDDEYDEELISIFLKKLKGDIEYIQTQIAEYLAGADIRKILENCHDAIGRLSSSANYMEYMSLTAFCEVWQNVVDGYLTDVSAGLVPDIAPGLQEFVDKIISVYPQIVESEQQNGDDEIFSDAEGADAGFDDSPKESNASAGKEDKDKEQAEEFEGVTAGEKTEHVAQTENVSADKALFDRLSTALETPEYANNVSEGSIDRVIEEIIESPGYEEESEPSSNEENGTIAGSHLLDQVVTSSTSDKKEVAVDNAHTDDIPDTAEEKIQDTSDYDEPVPGGGEKEEIKNDLSDHSPQSKLGLAKSEILEQEKQEKAAEGEQEQQSAKKASTFRSSIRVDAEKVDFLMNQVGELVVSRAYFAQLVNEIRGLEMQLLESSGTSKSQLKPLHEFAFRLSEAGVHLGRVSNELQEGVMKVRMLPIDQLFKRYPRLVRDLARNTNKDVKLVTRGEETELDKMVIESLSDPLIHIIRNSVDHGLENAEDRLRAGKPAQGTLILEAFHESDHIVVEISDDGRGLDTQRIKAKALERGLVSEDELERMPEQELTRLIMLPGFSTAEKATQTSGRGVGMDVVKKNIEKLNGTVELFSEAGKGTRLRIKIPLTMAIIQALMVRVGKEKFTIPLTSVEETLRVFRHEISEIEGVDVIHLRDNTMPIFQLAKIYNIDRQASQEGKMFVVVVSTGTQELGLVVDELLGQEEVVIKPLADYLRLESGFNGATILGDGGISLILDIPELVKIAKENQILRQGQRTLGFKRKKRNAAETAEQVH